MTTPLDINAHKALVRETARAARKELSDEARRVGSMDACERLVELAELATARVVLAYGAMSEEIDPGEAVMRLRERGAQIALPRIAGHGLLTLHLVVGPDDLERGPFGLTQPSESATAIEPGSIDVAIVPGVAFDCAGRRLGLGGGFYDRLLAQLDEECLTVGLAFDEQIVDEVPVFPHDHWVGALVTPTRTLRFGS